MDVIVNFFIGSFSTGISVFLSSVVEVRWDWGLVIIWWRD